MIFTIPPHPRPEPQPGAGGWGLVLISPKIFAGGAARRAAPAFLGRETGMKQKYVVLKDEEKEEYILREFAELDKDALSLLCEEHYPLETVDGAAQQGLGALIQALRTPNMYPPVSYIERIAELVMALRDGTAESPAEVVLDDVENIIRDRKEAEAAEAAEEEEESSDIDDLLEDDDNLEDDFEDDDIPSIDSNSSLKIADDDSLDVDDDG
jgi:hypothetical protein